MLQTSIAYRHGSVPDVRRLGVTHFGVLLEAQHDFRRSVPPCGDILGHDTVDSPFLVERCLSGSGQTKVTDLSSHVVVRYRLLAKALSDTVP